MNLADKRGIVRVAEVCGQNILCEFLDTLDNKTLAILGPANHIAILRIL